jgi:hypothetical protein
VLIEVAKKKDSHGFLFGAKPALHAIDAMAAWLHDRSARNIK